MGGHLVSTMATHSVTLESVIRGHHVFKEVWTPQLGEKLSLLQEKDNIHDRYAVSVVRDEELVGHVPREFSRAVWHFLAHDGHGYAEVTAKRRHGNGLEVPCTYTFVGSKKLVGKLQNIIERDSESGSKSAFA